MQQNEKNHVRVKATKRVRKETKPKDFDHFSYRSVVVEENGKIGKSLLTQYLRLKKH